MKMGENIPGRDFLGGNFPGQIHQREVWWVGILRVRAFQVGILLELLNYNLIYPFHLSRL